MAARHGDVDGWTSSVSRGAYGCDPWRGNLKNLPVLKRGLTFEVGDGSRIKF